ncbi:MAG: hypothetical protein M5U13_09120 [Thermoanaerobaculia bacterium]|nr:hypothetical protein [Thermoanaerobaculia bacterium]
METQVPPPDLDERLRSAAEEELSALVAEHAALLEPRQARLLLRNPFVTAPIVARLASERRLAAAYEVRRDVVSHPAAPRVLALDWVGGLFWPDLARVGRDPRIHPAVRWAADLALLDRLPGLAIGERTALARSAGAGVLAHLRYDPTPRVTVALLDNPRLTEGLLMPLLASERAAPACLAAVAASRRWGARAGVRSALARNPRTPLATVLGLLPTLCKAELRAVAADPRLGDAVRQRARLLSGEGPERPRRVDRTGAGG